MHQESVRVSMETQELWPQACVPHPLLNGVGIISWHGCPGLLGAAAHTTESLVLRVAGRDGMEDAISHVTLFCQYKRGSGGDNGSFLSSVCVGTFLDVGYIFGKLSYWGWIWWIMWVANLTTVIWGLSKTTRIVCPFWTHFQKKERQHLWVPSGLAD